MRSDELPSGKIWAVVPANDDDIGPKLIRDLRKQGINRSRSFARTNLWQAPSGSPQHSPRSIYTPAPLNSWLSAPAPV